MRTWFILRERMRMRKKVARPHAAIATIITMMAAAMDPCTFSIQ